jgi:hypothetical protein
MTRNINIASLIMIFLFSGSCVFLGFAPKLSIERHKGKLADSAVMYCQFQTRETDQKKLCKPLIFFPDGTLMIGSEAIDLSKSDYEYADYNNFYVSNGEVGWGRYKTKSNTIQLEYLLHYSPGGGYRGYKISKYAVQHGNDSLEVIPGHKHKNMPAILQANDTLVYVKTEYPGIKYIDPDIAWINNRGLF